MSHDPILTARAMGLFSEPTPESVNYRAAMDYYGPDHEEHDNTPTQNDIYDDISELERQISTWKISMGMLDMAFKNANSRQAREAYEDASSCAEDLIGFLQSAVSDLKDGAEP